MKNYITRLRTMYVSFFLIACAIATNASAMQLVKSDNVSDKFVREFPSMIFKRAYDRYSQCSPEEHIEIEKKVNGKVFLFNMATKLPMEINKKILTLMFNNNKAAADKMLRMPIADAVELRNWSYGVKKSHHCKIFNKIIHEEAKLYSYSWAKTGKTIKANLLTIDDIFELSEEIRHANKIFKNPGHVGCKDLDMLHKLIQRIPALAGRLNCEIFIYRSHKKLTVANCAEYVKEHLNVNNPAFVLYAGSVGLIFIAWLSRAIELNCCAKAAVNTIVEDNNNIRALHELIKQTGNVHYLDYVKPIVNEMAYSWTDSFKINSPFLLPFPLMALIAADCNYRSGQRFDLNDYSAVIGCGTLFSLILFLCSYIPFEQFPEEFAGLLTFITGIYAAGSLVHMLYPREQHIYWDKVSELLERKDIVICD